MESANWKKQKVQLRRGTAAEWTARNTLLLPAEPGYETDTGRLKLGDGLTRWNSLAYWGAAEVSSGDYGQVIVNQDGTWSVDITPADIGASAVGHTHSASEIASGTLSDSRLSGNVVLTSDARLSDARTPLSHTHDDRYYTEAEVNSLLAGKQAAGTYATLVGGTVPTNQLPTYVQSVAGRSGAVTLAKADVGLSNVDNTSDANKPISTAAQTALDLKAPLASPAFTGQVAIPAGSAAVPALAFGGDTNTGIYQPGASTFSIATNGNELIRGGLSNVYIYQSGSTERFRFELATATIYLSGATRAGIRFQSAYTTAGVDVGVLSFFNNSATMVGRMDCSSSAPDSTSTGTFRFQMRNAAGADVFGLIANAEGIRVPAGSVSAPSIAIQNDTDTGLWSPASNNIAVSTAGVERLRVEADGNVRIGAEETAAAMLDVQASNPEVYPLVSSGLNGQARSSVLTRNSSATTGAFASYGFLVTRGDGTQQVASIGAVSNEDTLYAPHLVFTVRSASGNQSERLRITAVGNVGVGTNAPTAMLDVNSSKVRVRSSHTPASASATGNAGDICWDSSYIYVCTATNTWRRIAHSTW